MATFNKFNSFVEALSEKAHNLGSDTLTIALTNTVLANITQVSYTYCSTRALTVSASSQTSGTYSLVVSDLTLTATGGSIGPFRYIVIYNDTASNDELIGWFDHGSEVTVTAGYTFLLDFGASVLTLV